LQLACLFPMVPAFILQALHDANSKLISQTDDLARTCLHVAVIHGVSADGVEVLLKARPSLAQLQDREGLLPLHYACKVHHPHSIRQSPEDKDKHVGLVRVVQILLKTYPAAASTPDVSGYLPLHHYCSANTNKNRQRRGEESHHYSQTVIRTLIRAAPESVFHAADSDGETPISLTRKDPALLEISGLLIRCGEECRKRMMNTTSTMDKKKSLCRALSPELVGIRMRSSAATTASIGSCSSS
jgi:ankyrin repeat protein